MKDAGYIGEHICRQIMMKFYIFIWRYNSLSWKDGLSKFKNKKNVHIYAFCLRKTNIKKKIKIFLGGGGTDYMTILKHSGW